MVSTGTLVGTLFQLEHNVMNRQERQGLQERNINNFDFYTLGVLGVLGG
jgi:hypothetical protein